MLQYLYSLIGTFGPNLPDFRGFWLGTCNIYPRCPAKNIWNFPIKIFFFKKSKIGHGGCTRNLIPSATTLTKFSKTFLVFYKWPDLTDLQGIVPSTVYTLSAPWARTDFDHRCLFDNVHTGQTNTHPCGHAPIWSDWHRPGSVFSRNKIGLHRTSRASLPNAIRQIS